MLNADKILLTFFSIHSVILKCVGLLPHGCNVPAAVPGITSAFNSQKRRKEQGQPILSLFIGKAKPSSNPAVSFSLHVTG